MPYEVDQETYNRVVKNFDFERLMNCLEVVEEIAQRVARGELQQELRKVSDRAKSRWPRFAPICSNWMTGHGQVL